MKNNVDQEITRNNPEKCLKKAHMDSETDAKNLEKHLKKAILARACVLMPPTVYLTPELGGFLSFFSNEIYVWFALNIFFSSFR